MMTPRTRTKTKGTTGKTWRAAHPSQRGSQNHKAKLTETTAQLLRLDRLYCQISIPTLAHRYGISTKTVWNVLKRNTWRHV